MWFSRSRDYKIKSGYRSRPAPEYFHDVLTEEGLVHQPDVYDFAAFLAKRFGTKRLLDVGCGHAQKLLPFANDFELVGLDFKDNIEWCRANSLPGTWLDVDFEKVFSLDPELASSSVIVCSDVIEHIIRPEKLLASLRKLLDSAECLVLSTPDRDRVRGIGDYGPPANPFHVREWSLSELDAFLTSEKLAPEFAGLTFNNNRDLLKRTSLLVCNRDRRRPAAPTGFRVRAYICTYNEADVIGEVARHLNSNGIEVHVVDNWSSDGTYDVLTALKQEGIVQEVTRFPIEKGCDTYEWAKLLNHVDSLAAASGADWCLHHDADEIRLAPWPEVKLRDAIHVAQARGFNAIDHTVLNFIPTDESFETTGKLESLKYCEFGRNPGHFCQVKGWKNPGTKVGLAESGGHIPSALDLRIFPFKFLMKHYPIRSQAHGERKIFAERQPRWNAEERQKGWHIQYDQYPKGTKFTREPEGLIEWKFFDDYLVERLSGVGILR